MRLIFEEYFKDLKNWNFEYGFIRNNELQYYTDKNVSYGDGLKIYGKKERIGNKLYDPSSFDWRLNREFADYTSSSINTKDKFSFKYGVMEVKAKIPVADGAWPAIWMLGSEEEYPYCDEVDVMEYYLCEERPTILANFMWSETGLYNWSTKQISLEYFQSKDEHWADKFHIWKTIWTSKCFQIFIDDELINSINTEDIPGNKFKKNYYILLNLAIGRKCFYPKDESLPLVYEIEYVKVYQE